MTTTIDPVTEYAGDTPVKTDNDTDFNAAMDSELVYFNNIATEINVTVGQINTVGSEMESLATDAAASAVTAANEATASANSAVSSSGFADDAEAFKDSAEAAAIAAQAGAGLPTLTQTGDVLTITDFATNAVGFQPASGGGLKPLLTVTAASVATVEFTDLASHGYKRFVIIGDNLVTSSTSTSLKVRLSNDNGSTWLSGTSDYAGVREFLYTSSSTAITNNVSGEWDSDYMYMGFWGNQSGALTMSISSPLSASINTTLSSETDSLLGVVSSFYKVRASGLVKTAAVNNAIQIYPSSGTISGTFTLYGVLEA